MNAECTRTKLRFQGLDGRDVVGRFDGGEITSDAGGVLLREVEQRTRILGRLSECFTDYRDPDRVEHPVEALIKQRVLGLCLGYEDLNDHDELCRDRLLALLCDRDDLTGEFRRVESDRGKPLAGKSTLNRPERTPLEGPEGAYKKIVADPAGMDELLLEVFVEAHLEPPEEVILDVDATDDPLHGKQEGRFFHGYYKGDYIPKSQFDRSFGLELEGPKECLAGLLERRSRHINLFPQFFAIRLVGPLGKAHCGGFLYRVGGSLLTALHGRSVSLFCSQGHSPREPGTPCGHYSILPGEDTFLQVYGRLGIHEVVVPAEPARKNLIPHLLDRFRDSVLGSKG